MSESASLTRGLRAILHPRLVVSAVVAALLGMVRFAAQPLPMEQLPYRPGS